MSVAEIALGVLAGLALFLYGVSRLATGMRAVAGERAQRLLARATTNRFAGVATGTVVTALLDSSSVTIIMVIALVDAGLLSARQSLGVILGANIGTTISSQLIALDVQRYSPVLLAAGVLLLVGTQAETWRNTGAAIFGLGLIFYGLAQMGAAVEPLKGSARFAEWMTQLERPAFGVISGAVVTLVLQSSSATVGIAITLASQGLLELPAAVAVMLGAEIGTCADTLVATIGRSAAALRAGVFHLGFNLLTVAIGVALLTPLVNVVLMIGGDRAQQVANAHVLFNVFGAAALVLFLSPINLMLTRLIPAPDAVATHAGGPRAVTG